MCRSSCASATCPTRARRLPAHRAALRLRRQRQERRARHRPPRTHRQHRPDRPHRPAPDRPDRHAAPRRRQLFRLPIISRLMPGTLYLIPNTLGPTDAAPRALSHVLPEQVQDDRLATRLFRRRKRQDGARLPETGRDRPSAGAAAAGNPDRRTEREHAAGGAGRPAGAAAGRRDAGLVSEAGVPAVADPGADLVRLAHQHGITVRPLVGPVLAAAGRDGERPERPELRLQRLPADRRGPAHQAHPATGTALAREKQTQLLIETPYRNGAMLEALVASACQPGT
jgi:16S rRNA (cytidine1402-2'-O)-methyltransferase